MNRLIPPCEQVTYVLGLEDGCVYVGLTSHLNHRLNAHSAGSSSSSAWCRTHKPIEVKGIHPGDKERALYWKCCAKYGREKVRGWRFVHDKPHW
jgi:predicted GIY-YIG superfamily endonuclease